MNLTDLTDVLETKAQTPAAPLAVVRLQGVRRRIRARRHRQMASAGGFAALCVAAVILAPGLSGLHAEPTPPANTDEPSPTQTSDPLRFAADVAGDPLIAQAVSRPGASELVVRFTPADTRLAVSAFCRMPGVTVPNEGRSPFEFDAQINGHPFSGGDCSSDDSAGGSTISYGDEDSKENRDSWADLEVVPGRESVLRMTVKPGKGKSEIPSMTRLGVGIYALSGERVVDAGVPIKVRAEVDGHEYRLAGHTAAAVTAKRRHLSLTVPAGTHPVMLLFGNPGGGASETTNWEESASLLVDGEMRSSTSGGGVASNELLDDANAHALEFRVGPGLGGMMVLAYYVRID